MVSIISSKTSVHYLGLEVLSMFGHQLAFDPLINRVSTRPDIIHLGYFSIRTLMQCKQFAKALDAHIISCNLVTLIICVV